MKLRKAYRTENFFRRIEERTADDPQGEQSQAPGIHEAVYTFTRGQKGVHFNEMKGDVGMVDHDHQK